MVSFVNIVVCGCHTHTEMKEILLIFHGKYNLIDNYFIIIKIIVRQAELSRSLL